MPVFANALIDILALIIILTVIVADRRRRPPEREGRRIFRALLYLITGVLLFDIPAWLLDGRLFPAARPLLLALNTLYYLFQISFSYLWLLLADYWNRPSGGGQEKRRWLYAVPLLLELLVILLNPFTGWVFTIGPDNVYSRGTYYLFNLIPYYLYVVGSIALSIRGFHRADGQERRRQSLSLIVFMFLPVCGVVLETFFYGVSWTWPFTALSLLMVYLSVQQQQLSEQRMEALQKAGEAERLKNELTNSRVAIMLSQMQPHFLYNALSSIQALCTRDPQLAARAAGDFAEFLRSNMDSLTDGKPVSFVKELEHTKHYLALEQIRFQDRLRVVYDIKTDLFRIPTLTLQPMVENAVRYGIMQRIEGGTVTISTGETAEAFVVAVSDDGVGFDPAQVKDDGRAHIGIQNVRDRLRAMCGGSLDIESTPGAGTNVRITIPKRALQGGEPC